MEYWLTIDDVAASDSVLRQYHLENLADVITKLHDISDDASNRRLPTADINLGVSLFEGNRSIWSSPSAKPTLIVDLNHRPGDYECPEERKSNWNDSEPERLQYHRDMATLEYTKFTYMLTYIERAFRQPDLGKVPT
jgi:hypothetical protein